MNQDERRFDFHGLGLALKRAREEKGWTQAYVAELVDRDSRTIMNIENKGQYPSFDLFVKLITMFDVSVDQFIHADGGARSSSCRKHIDVLLSSMNEKELVVMGGHSRRAQESQRNGGSRIRASVCFFCAILGAAAKWQAMPLWPQVAQRRLVGARPKPGTSGQHGPKCQRRFVPYSHTLNAPFHAFCPARCSPAEYQCSP